VLVSLGGVGEALEGIREVDPARLSPLAGEGVTGASVVGVVSALAWGLGYFGQPHIIVRFMAMRDALSAGRARRIGISWMVISLVGAVVTGLLGIAYVNRIGLDLSDPEQIVLALSQALLHPLLVGAIFAAALAAIMSTVSSQLIVCSSAFVEDLYRIVRKDASPRQLVVLGRVAVLAVAVIATVLALNPADTILNLVAFAWAGFGASFGPAILLSLFWRRLTTWGALAGMVTGAVTVILWKQFGPEIFGATLYEIVPGFLANLLVAVVVSRRTYKPDEEMEREFTAAAQGARRTPAV